MAATLYPSESEIRGYLINEYSIIMRWCRDHAIRVENLSKYSQVDPPFTLNELADADNIKTDLIDIADKIEELIEYMGGRKP